ncbi:MAG: hypothetical protein EP344_02875, partial [Bacteroidetes bacterium]
MRGFRKTATGIGDLDYITLTCYIALVMTGWLMIYAVNYNAEAPWAAVFDLGESAGKQLFFIVVCTVILFFIQMSDWTFWRTLAFPIYLLSLLLLLGTLVFGREVNGANAWYQFGGFSFQPSEIAKFSTSLAMAGYLSATGVTLRDTKSRMYALGIFLVPVLIILLQKDTGSALIFFSFLLVLFREGLPSFWYVLGFGTALMVILGLLYEVQNVIAVLILVASFRLISIHRNTRPWWIAFAVVAALFIWWQDLFAWIAELKHPPVPADPAAIETPAPVPAEAAAPLISPLWVVVPPLVLFLAGFFKSYIRKNNIIQRRLQLMV